MVLELAPVGDGILVLTLKDRKYEWAFVGADRLIHDRSGEPVDCHGEPGRR